MQERILAEAKLPDGATYRLTRHDVGKYVTYMTEARKGELYTRHQYTTLDDALGEFRQVAEERGADSLADNLYEDEIFGHGE